MELQSGRDLWHLSPPQQGFMDLIGALPDEILLLILTRLRCVRTAVQTGLLSRRWRGLWTGLTDLTLRGLEKPAMIEAALARFAASTPVVFTLNICLQTGHTAKLASSSLRAAARLSPRELVFTCSIEIAESADIKLPCFDCTTSIELGIYSFERVRIVPSLTRDHEFTSLERLSISGYIFNLGALLNRCPRLRALSITSPHRHVIPITLPANSAFPMLENLSLTGGIVGLGSLLNGCQCLHVLSLKVTHLDSQELTLAPAGPFLRLEKLSLSGNISYLDTLLKQCPCLHVLSATFRGMPLRSIKAALAALEEAATPLGLTLSLLDISIPWEDNVSAASFASLLQTTARLSPQELVLDDSFSMVYANIHINADLPCFRHTTSIEMRWQHVRFTSLPMDEFPVLENLSLTGCCSTVDVGSLVTRCPRLRVLKINIATATGNITVRSPSLQKLTVNLDVRIECHNIDIVTPMLKQLHLHFCAGRDTGVSISAEVLEKFFWWSCYAVPLALGSWRLQKMRVHTIEKSDVDNREYELRLHLNDGNHLDPQLNFAEEMEKLPVTNFSALELKFEPACHVYGALVLQLLQMHRICAATKKLKVDLTWSPKAREAC
ncbi:hypothetical protein VPH35_080559 [Triticum aestivum]|uniref:uncharacterized protein n=1 Tax=Triticum aestivum TaxID=4565 RepID=UPI001D02C87A|nr:uncharacterized protein LOC123100736 [Triticum aestivum]